METQIFYWTGAVLWWAICGCVILCILAAAIFAPIAVFSRCKQHMWAWRVAANISISGLTMEEINRAGKNPDMPDIAPEDLLRWVQRVKSESDKIREKKEAA